MDGCEDPMIYIKYLGTLKFKRKALLNDSHYCEPQITSPEN